MKRLVCLCVLLLGLPACIGSFLPSPEQLDALGRDTASVCFSVQTPYGTGKFARTNITSGNVVCDSDGLKVQSDAQKIGVPILVTPTLSIGPPTVTPR